MDGFTGHELVRQKTEHRFDDQKEDFGDFQGVGHDLDPHSVPDNSNLANQIGRMSPTPRKSERERKNISYDKLNKGAANSDDEFASQNLDRQQSFTLPGTKDMKKKLVPQGNAAELIKQNEELV